MLASDQSEEQRLNRSVQCCGAQPDAHCSHMAGLRLTIYERKMLYGMDTTDVLECFRAGLSIP
jgi:hypothetical protein